MISNIRTPDGYWLSVEKGGDSSASNPGLPLLLFKHELTAKAGSGRSLDDESYNGS
jgi:hypothetical protein